jgi:ectoine hydroxylase-related dioxygenase (phytanoyl-CoA dioxygenase family)
MIRRKHGVLSISDRPVRQESLALQEEGCAVLAGVFSPEEIAALAQEIETVFETTTPDRPHDKANEWRHAMFNRSPLSQKAIGHPRILEVIEPLLGEDCHVIANTAWRNAAGHQGGPWHIDAGPHVPRPEGASWPEAIPYPVFVIGAHLFLEDCPLEAGPTAVLPGSHKSGRPPPFLGHTAMDVTYEGRGPVFLTAQAGDVALFVSDAWHRGSPAKTGVRRFFLQAHYGRRDIAQRVLTTAESNHVSPEAAARAQTDRERALIGLHAPFFYDG